MKKNSRKYSRKRVQRGGSCTIDVTDAPDTGIKTAQITYDRDSIHIQVFDRQILGSPNPIAGGRLEILQYIRGNDYWTYFTPQFDSRTDPLQILFRILLAQLKQDGILDSTKSVDGTHTVDQYIQANAEPAARPVEMSVDELTELLKGLTI